MARAILGLLERRLQKDDFYTKMPLHTTVISRTVLSYQTGSHSLAAYSNVAIRTQSDHHVTQLPVPSVSSCSIQPQRRRSIGKHEIKAGLGRGVRKDGCQTLLLDPCLPRNLAILPAAGRQDSCRRRIAQARCPCLRTSHGECCESPVNYFLKQL